MSTEPIAGRELQVAILGALSRLGSGTASEVSAALPPAFAREYTTIATVLGRLAERGLVARSRTGRTWQYAPVQPASDVAADMVVSLLGGLDEDQRKAALAGVLAKFRLTNT